MNKLAEAIIWRDEVSRNRVIKRRYGNKSYLCFKGLITSHELAAICLAANSYYEAIDSNLRIYWQAGELRPAMYNKKNVRPWATMGNSDCPNGNYPK